jgi:hypothetical protein
MKRKDPKTLKKTTLRLAKDHTWKAPAGYKILVIEAGAVSLNIPDTWHLVEFNPVKVVDHKPPNDTAGFHVSYWRTPAGVDWSGLPLGPLLEQSAAGESHEVLSRSEIFTHPRTDLELVWTQHLFMDPKEKRPAYSNIALARGFNIHVLITFSFWEEDLEKFKPTWEELMRSLQLGRIIQDPTKGIPTH